MNSPDEMNNEAYTPTNEEVAAPETAEEAVRTAEWHSVSYGAELDTVAPKKKRGGKGKRVALIAAALAFALLLSLFAGVGGAMLAYRYLPDNGSYGAGTGGTGGSIFGEQSGSGTGGTGGDLTGTTPYPADTDPYDYAAAYAALVKNNDEALKGSANGSAGNARNLSSR